MLNVLIVDDERIIREGIRKNIKWENYDMQVISTAANVNQAIKTVRENTVDVIILDIRMPEKTGFDLITQLIEENYNPQVIIVSSYDDFFYAQKACSYQMVCDYILKPINLKLLEESILKLKKPTVKTTTSYNNDDSEKYIELITELEKIGFDKQEFLKQLIDEDVNFIMKKWQHVESFMEDEDKFSINIVKRFCHDLIRYLEDAFKTQRYGVCEYLIEHKDIKDPIYLFENKEKLLNYMRVQIMKICEKSYNVLFQCKTIIVSNALQRIKADYSNLDFNLTTLSFELDITPNYLSQLFKKETGETFTKYLTAYRISKAKEILKNTQEKLAEIAMEVGFADEKYFIKVFKTETGMTPKKFAQKSRLRPDL